MLYSLIVVFGVLSYWLRYMTIIRIDETGVSAPRTGCSFWPTTVPWSQIASCELVVVRDTWDKVVVTYPVLKNASGEVLFAGLRANFLHANPGDQQKVLQALEMRFPKLEVDPWALTR